MISPWFYIKSFYIILSKLIHAQCSGKYVCEQSHTYYTGQFVSHPPDIVPGPISLSFHNDTIFAGEWGHTRKTPLSHSISPYIHFKHGSLFFTDP